MLFTFLVILLVSSLSSANYNVGCTEKDLQRDFPARLRRSTITVATVVNAPPFVTRVGNGAPCGFDIDLLNLIAFIYRINFKYVYLPFQSLLSAVQNDVNTISISSQTITPERLLLVGAVQYFKTGTAFLVKSTYGGTINGLADSCGKSVAVIQGSTQEADLKKQQAGCPPSSPLTIISVATSAERTNKVLNGEAVAAIGDEANLIAVALDSNNQLKVVGTPYNVQPYGIFYNKKNRDLPCALVNAINYLIQEGVYKDLLTRYSFSYKNNGICPSRINLNGPTCSKQYTPSTKTCKVYLG